MLKPLLAALRPALVLTALFAALLGFAYPLLVTALAQLAVPGAANGSLITRHGVVVGSRLIGQNFARPDYFHPRLSAAGAGYDATASGGSNLGPTSQALADRLHHDVAALHLSHAGVPAGAIPADMLTTSASGLDPDISPENAALQVPRVAAARHVAPAQIAALVKAHTASPWLGLFGEPTVNVLALNLALDQQTVH